MKELIFYCFEITLQNNTTLFLTSYTHKYVINSKNYNPSSGINIVEIETNNTSLLKVILHGITENNGITHNLNLEDSIWKILWVYNDNVIREERLLLTEYVLNNLEFIITLNSETIKYNTDLLKNFSKTCRACFGDHKCGVDIVQFSEECRIRSVERDFSLKLTKITKPSGYFDGGTLLICIENQQFSFSIREQIQDQIFLNLENDVHISLLSQNKVIRLYPNCDKHFLTCANKYNNVINFRGEPFIPNSTYNLE